MKTSRFHSGVAFFRHLAQEVASQRFHGRISQGGTLFAIVVLDSYEMTLARIFTVDFPPIHGD